MRYNVVDIANMFRSMWAKAISVLNDAQFTNGTHNVGIFNILVAFFVLGIIISVLWKGARK